MTDETHSPPEQIGTLRKIARVIGYVELLIGSICLLTILVLVFFQALQRYLPIDQVPWTGETAEFAMVWLTFSAAGLLVTSRGHIALELVDTFRNRTLVQFVQVFALVVVCAAGVGLTIEAFALIGSQGILRSPVLRIPMSWIYLPVAIGLVSTTVRAAISAIDIAKNGAVAPSYDRDENETTGEVTTS